MNIFALRHSIYPLTADIDITTTTSKEVTRANLARYRRKSPKCNWAQLQNAASNFRGHDVDTPALVIEMARNSVRGCSDTLADKEYSQRFFTGVSTFSTKDLKGKPLNLRGAFTMPDDE